MLARRLERRPQQIGKLDDHAIGRCRIAMHERRDAVECIEKKVWSELASQYLELRLREPAAQLGGELLPLLPTTVKQNSMHDRDHSPEDHRLDDEISSQSTRQRETPRRAQERRELHENGVLHDDGDAAAREVQQDIRAPMPTIDGKPLRHPEEERSEDAARVPI